jgi:hypothetical protein
MMDAEQQLEEYLKARKLVELAEGAMPWLSTLEDPVR